jgi:putative ABC transport system permease protein
MVHNYLKIAWRNLIRNKATSFINLFGLSVGMTAAVLILLWVQNENSFDNYHPGAANIYRVSSSIKINGDETWLWESAPMPLANAAKKDIPEIEQSAQLLDAGKVIFNINNQLLAEDKCAYVDRNWFGLFHYDFLYGDTIAFNQNPFSLVVNESTAKKYFGVEKAIGKVISINNENYTVQAVIKDNPANSSFQFNCLMPLAAHLSNPDARKNDENWGNFGYLTFLKLRSDANISRVTQKLNATLNKNKKDNQVVTSLLPLTSMYFEEGLQSSQFVHGNKKTTYIFTALALLLLLTACINYVNLTTAKASLRAKEVSVRKIVGAKRAGLFYQFMAESLTVSFIALLITLLLVQLTLPLFSTLSEKHFSASVSSFEVWKVLLGTLLFATILNGIYPAALLSSFKPLQVFRGRSILKVKDSSMRKGLVVFQFTLSVMLIIGSIVIFKQLNFIQQSDRGYSAAQVISSELSFEKYESFKDEKERELFFSSLKQELKAESSIAGVTIASSPIVDLHSVSSGNADWDGRDSTFNPSIANFSADADFKNVLGVQMKQGRWFEKGTLDLHNYILNETAIAQLNLHKPVIGQRFTWGGDTGQVIGIVKDFHYKSMHEKIAPMVIRNNNGAGFFIYIKTTPGDAIKALDVVEAKWKQFFTSEPFNYTFLDETFNNVYKTDIKVSRIVLIFSVITVIISALGLFGLAAFTAEQRTKEIGIRKVLGATVINITTLLSKDFVKLVVVAIVIASPVAYMAMHKWLQDFAYRINIGWSIFVLAGATAILIALLTVSFQAIKAALANPVKSLRTE